MPGSAIMHAMVVVPAGAIALTNSRIIKFENVVKLWGGALKICLRCNSCLHGPLAKCEA